MATFLGELRRPINCISWSLKVLTIPGVEVWEWRQHLERCSEADAEFVGFFPDRSRYPVLPWFATHGRDYPGQVSIVVSKEGDSIQDWLLESKLGAFVGVYLHTVREAPEIWGDDRDFSIAYLRSLGYRGIIPCRGEPVPLRRR